MQCCVSIISIVIHVIWSDFKGFGGNERSLTLYDATGREVAALATGFMAAGAHDVPFQRGDIPSGVYFYRLESGGQSATRAFGTF
jgi:hypothetical protein